MENIKVFGPGCGKCKTTYNNVLDTLKETGIEANIEEIVDIEEMMKYYILSRPVLMIEEVIKIKGRIAHTNEIKTLSVQ